MPIPTVAELRQPVIKAMTELGGEVTNQQMRELVARQIELTPEEIQQKHKGDNRTELEYRLAWVRTKLSKDGVVERSGPGRWRLVEVSKAVD